MNRTKQFDGFLRRVGGRLQPGEELFRFEVLLPVTVVAWLLAAIYLGIGTLGGVRDRVFPWDAVEVLLVCPWCLLLRRRGQTALAAMILLVVLSHPIAFITAAYGLDSVAPAMFMPTIALAGLIVGRRMVAFWTLISAVVCAYVTINSPRGGFTVPVMTVWSAIFIATAMLVVMLADRLETLLRISRDQEEATRAAVLQERSRMARDLHDSLAQGFTGVIVQLRAAELALATAPECAPEHLARARKSAEQGLVTAKQSVWALRNFDASDFETALRQLTHDRFQGTSLAVAIEISARPVWSKEQVETALAIANESITNVFKHANATSVSIRLSRTDAGTALEVADDGCGFDCGSSTGFGILGMRERAIAAGGALSIASNATTGTVVRLEVAHG